ncbi:hypothetical protein [Nisaea sp.]|uniref:hypothetical protein n=1 Tax=Nisaea sp. TaxID=2024842 RepID=UPI0032ED356F
MTLQTTRQELFEEIWERPMTKVAADYGISDVALKKICEKHRIPVPGRGYWAKKAAGKPVKKALFRKVSDAAVEHILIYGSALNDLPRTVQAARKEAKRRERLPENKIEVEAVPVPEDLHPKVAQTRKKLERAKSNPNGLVAVKGDGIFNVEIGPKSIDRVSSFLHSLLNAAESRGFIIVKGVHALVLVADGETLEFSVSEQVTRSRHIPTQAELEAIHQWEGRQARRSRSWDDFDWTPKPNPPEWDHAPNGHIRFQITESKYVYGGLRKSFGDGKTQRIESLINPILEAFSTWSAAIKAKRVDDERREREWKEAERRREEQRRNVALEKKRIEVLTHDLDRRRRRQEVLDYITDVEASLFSGNYDNPEAVRQWIKWAQNYAERLDPMSDGPPILLQFENFKPWELS